MTSLNRGNLFLLELIVDSVHLDYNNKERNFIDSETCVTFNFLNNGPIYIREWEFNNNSTCSENDYVKSGKSCLFSLDPAKMIQAYTNFNLVIAVYKIMYADSNPQMVQAGTACVSLVHLYQQVMEQMNSDSGNVSGKTMQGSFVLASSDDKIIGQISLFVRMSCFGKTLVSTVKISVSGDADNLKYVAQQEPIPKPKHGSGELYSFQQSDAKSSSNFQIDDNNNNENTNEFSEYLQYYEK